MKVEMALVYALQAIFIADCRQQLRQGEISGESESKEEIKHVEARSEQETPVKLSYDQDVGTSGHGKYLWTKEKIKEQVERENAAGSFADALAPNQHYSIANLFKDLGRRFVLQYPYYEKEKQELEDIKAEDYFHKSILQDSKAKIEREDLKLLAVRASPELVLSVARQSKALEDSKVVNPADELIKKQSLRSGEYWNGVWKEDVDPDILRTGYDQLPLQGSVRTKIMPGTKLYQLISVLKQISPRFLYVMNVN